MTGRRRWLLGGVIALAVVVALTAAGLVLYGRGGGALPDALGFLRPASSGLLSPSGPEETVLRTLRMAGYERAVVGEADEVAVVRVELPALASPPDVALTWQTAMAAVSAAFPHATRVVVQVFDPDGQALVEARAPLAAVRRAVASDDVAALRAATGLVYLSEEER